MNKLVEIRVSDANESLSRTLSTLERAKDRRKEAAALEGQLRDLLRVDESIEFIKALISYCKKMEDVQGDWPLLPAKVNAGEQAVDRLTAQLVNIQKRAAKLKESSFNLEQLKTHRNKTVSLLQTKQSELNHIRSQAREQKQTPLELLKSIEKAKPLWGEHIETVAGMVLRDERFDDGLCALADRIIDICGGHAPFGATNTLNILGRDHTVLKDLHYTVYFRFPTWSVWGLPLTAHEFWHAACPGLESFKDRLSEIPQALRVWSEPLVQDCLADAFATFVIGPAYAFACILLLLDVNSPQDRVRAESVFATLDHLARGQEAWYPFASDLQKCWIEASSIIGSAQPTASLCLLAQGNARCHLVDRLLECYWEHHAAGCGREEQSERTVCELKAISCDLAEANGHCPMMDTALIGKMRAALLEFMPPQLRYSVETWAADGEKLMGSLNASEEEWESISKDTLVFDEDVDLRHVLHAGWWSRWRTSEQDIERIKMVAGRVRQLCRKVVEQRPKSAFLDDVNGPN